MARFSFMAATLILAAALLPGTVRAQQQEPPTIFMTTWMCNRGAVEGIVNNARERDLPIAQELVDEGKIWSYGVLHHRWGDEWNYVTVLVADDVAAGIAANTEFGQRYEERHGEDDSFLEHCPTHRDGIYVGSYSTQAAPGMTPEPPYIVSMSYFACPFNKMEVVVNADREALLPAAQASINEGKGYWTGAMQHAWASEWTYVIVRAAKDIPTLLSFIEDTGGRIEEDDAEPPIDMCGKHKDNIYQLVLETKPRSDADEAGG